MLPFHATPSTPPHTTTPFEVSKETFEHLTTKIEKLENRTNGLEEELLNVTRFLEKQFPIDEVPPVVAEAHAVAAEALAVVPPIAAVAHAGAVDRVYDTFLNANKKQHDLPLLPTESMTKLKGATVRNGWDGSEYIYIYAIPFPHFVCRVTQRARLPPYTPITQSSRRPSRLRTTARTSAVSRVARC